MDRRLPDLDHPARCGLPADGLIETVEALASRANEPRRALLRGEREGLDVRAGGFGHRSPFGANNEIKACSAGVPSPSKPTV